MYGQRQHILKGLYTRCPSLDHPRLEDEDEDANPVKANLFGINNISIHIIQDIDKDVNKLDPLHGELKNSLDVVRLTVVGTER